MSPYLESVVGSTMKSLRQQQQQEQSQLLGNQISAGAFGGDRGRIAQANLARQQEMATGQTLSGLLNQGYGQALATAQQQQGVSLGAEQANRAAQAQAAQQMAALGQQGFGQGLAAAQQRAALAQQGFGQNITTAQQQAALGQQLYGQQMGVAQAQQGLGQQGFAQNMSQAQQNQALAQQMYSQGANTAQIQAALAQQQAAQGIQLGQLQAGLGAQAFGQGAQMAQQQANVGQALFGQGATTAQQQAALAQQAYAQQMGQGQQMAAIGQQGFGQNLAQAQQLAALGQQGFGQNLAQAQQLGALGQQAYAQMMGQGQQMASIGQQGFGQGMAAAQAQQALGQGMYGMGAGVSQGLAGIGTGAQTAALQGGQAQLAAGQMEQQTQQAQNQALYNQFLQQQGYPFQTTQFLGNLAMGTGALSGSTTTTTQPSSIWSDKRLKDDIEPIGKTYDGQDIVRYRYKGEPATQIGLLAQDVEKKHPEAVGEAAGYKTVNYHDATDEAAARAPHKAYGGGLSPASMGGGVFREDAGQGFAVGGAPGGDDILAQINALVNTHQGMFPYGKAGMYGSGLGKAGPYGSSLMPSPNRGLMRAEHVGPRMENISAMEGLGRVSRTGENIEKMYGQGKSGLSAIREQTSLSPGYQAQGPTPSGAPVSERGTIADWLDSLRRGSSPSESSNLPLPADPNAAYGVMPATSARGGAIRPRLASGGMPYSEAENEYVDEDLTKPFKPQTLQPTAASKPGQSGGMGEMLGGLGNIASLYKMGEKGLPFLEKGISGLGGLFSGAGGAAGATGAAEGAAALGAAEGAAGLGGIEGLLSLFALSDKRAKENIEPIGELFDGQKVYRYNYKEKGLAPRKNYRDGGGGAPATGGDPIQDEVIHGYSRRAIEDMFNQGIIPLESSGRQFNERGEPLRSSAGATGIAQVMPRTGPEAARLAGLEWDPQRFENDPNYNRDLGLAYYTDRVRQHGDPIRAAGGYNAGPGRLESAIAGGGDWFSRLPTETQNYMRNFVARVEPTGLISPVLAEQTFGRQGQAAPAQPAGGLAPPARREAAQPEEKDWLRERLNKNEYWLVPLLTGLGTMASSPSRYLGASILQGLMGAGQAYQSTMSAEAQRAKMAEEMKGIQATTRGREVSTEATRAAIAMSAYDPRTGRVRVYNARGGFEFIPLSDYNDNPSRFDIAPYSSGELHGMQIAAPPQQTSGQQEPQQPAIPPAGQVRRQFSAEVPSVGYSPENTPVYVDLSDPLREFARQRRREIENTPGTQVPAAENAHTNIVPIADRAARQSRETAARRNDFAMQLALLPETGVLAPGPLAERYGQSMASWVSSILAAAGIPPRTFLPSEFSDATAIRDTINKLKTEYGAELQRSSGSRAFNELNTLLTAVPSGGIDRRAAAHIMADAFVRDQRNVDFYNFTRRVMNETGLNPNQQTHAGADLGELFSNSQDPAYVGEKKFIETLMLNKITPPGRSPMPVLNYVLESRGQLPDEVRNQLADLARRNGANPDHVMRYFRMQ
jgi:hypothetical protein